jgi:3-keto-5-aminohexanoate cleavage enzyme
MGKLIITCALCGAGTTKKLNPNVPVTSDEIAADSVACVKAGASVLHLHVRDKDGANTMDTNIFVEVVDKVRAALKAEGLDAVLNLTTSGSKFADELRMAHLYKLMPEMCSYDPGSMNWANSYVFLNSPPFLEKLGKVTQELDIKPECEIFDAGMIGNIEYYIKKGVLKTPCHVQFVLGVSGGMPGNLEALAYLLPKIPAGSTWSITGIGRSHVPCMLMGLAAECDGLRVGLEDNIFLDRRVLATNAQLVERAVHYGKMAGREIANATETREILGLTQKVLF